MTDRSGAGQQRAREGGPARAKPRPEEQWFTHLLASKPPRDRKAAAAAVLTSCAVHGLIIGLAIWGTLQMAKAEEEEETYSLIVIGEGTSSLIGLPEAPPPPPAPEAQPPPDPNVPRGFQVIALPDIIPPEIPPPSLYETVESDFTGEGVEGGEGGTGRGAGGGGSGVRGLMPPVPRAVYMAPLERPAAVRGRQVTVWVFISEAGVVDSVRLEPPTPDRRYNEDLMREARQWVFEPAVLAGRAVAVWYSYTWKL